MPVSKPPTAAAYVFWALSNLNLHGLKLMQAITSLVVHTRKKEKSKKNWLKWWRIVDKRMEKV